MLSLSKFAIFAHESYRSYSGNSSKTVCDLLPLSVMRIFGEIMICLSTLSKLGPNVGEATDSFVYFASSSQIFWLFVGRSRLLIALAFLNF
jgi:hypothetical protein